MYYLGPLLLHAYGLALAVGILVAARVAERRWVARGHPATEFANLVTWVVVAGIVGARLYHVVSDFQLFTGNPWTIVAIWQGGLSIWGAVAGGGVAVAVLARRRNLDAGDLVDSIAPAVALGQAIGRWGNWFNQEIFGTPTTLPWGLEIDRAHRPPGYEQFVTFHPMFLYESLYAIHRVRCPGLDGAAVPTRKGPGVRRVRRPLHGGTIRLREHAHRPRPHDRTAAPQRVGQPVRIRDWMELVSVSGSAGSRRAGDEIGRMRSTTPLGDMSPSGTTVVRFQHRE